jgi:hypothetical protein
VLSECLQHQNLQCLDYYPLTLVLGRTFEQVGRVLKTRGEADLGRLFILIGRAFPYLACAGSSPASVDLSAYRQDAVRVPPSMRVIPIKVVT